MCALNSEWVTKSIEYHGQPLQKVWEGEHGIQSLQNIGVRSPDFTLYQMRQKAFVFQDRAKRLKIHSFIAKKANELFVTDPAKECARSFDTSIAIGDGASAATGEIPIMQQQQFTINQPNQRKNNNAESNLNFRIICRYATNKCVSTWESQSIQFGEENLLGL